MQNIKYRETMELMPCPSCDGRDVSVISSTDGGVHHVVCNTLGCWMSGPAGETRQGAIRKWNALHFPPAGKGQGI